MGFRNGAYATVWEVTPVSDTMTKVRLSVSRKNKQTDEYETDFSGFVAFVGIRAARDAAVLKERDRIKLGDTDVTTKYDKEKKISYTNFTVFSFEMAESLGNTSGNVHQNVYETNVLSNTPSTPNSAGEVDSNSVDGDALSNGELPF